VVGPGRALDVSGIVRRQLQASRYVIAIELPSTANAPQGRDGDSSVAATEGRNVDDRQAMEVFTSSRAVFVCRRDGTQGTRNCMNCRSLKSCLN
jgi:hypothetical protein